MKSRLYAAVIGTTAIGSVVGLAAAETPVLAAGYQLPAGQQTCASGQPKLDYEYGPSETWSNVCGTGIWTWNYNSNWVLAFRMPTTPYHRIWLHGSSNGSEWSTCLYSQGEDVFPAYNFDVPTDIQVSDNTSPC